MDGSKQAGRQLRQLAAPFLERGNRDALAAALEDRWSADCLALLTDDDEADTVQLAATCLGLVGALAHAPALARLLHHTQPAVWRAAENALWSIWFRAGGPECQRLVRTAADLLDGRHPRRAIPVLDDVVRRSPAFAEGYHQRAIAHIMLGEHEAGLRDARRACRAHASHFAAWACQGDCHAQLGRYAEALECYRAALRIHPRLDLVRQSIRELREHADLAHAL